MYKKLLRRLLLTFAGLTAIIVLLVILTPQEQAAFRAALFIPQILPGVPIRTSTPFSM